MAAPGEQPPNPGLIVPPVELQQVAMKAVIYNGVGDVLVLREASSKSYADGTNAGRYGLPGGRLELGEDPNEGLLREVLEETGRDIVIGKPLGYGSWSPIIPGKPRPQIIGIFVEGTLLDGHDSEIRVSEEHSRALWIGRTAFGELNRDGRIVTPDNDIIHGFLSPLRQRRS
ncbi:MAG: NUDIX domain-containing protein [Candidatus Saccharimonadales bacterium]